MAHISEVNRAAARPRLERITKLLSAGLSQAEIARVLGLSRERVRQLVGKAKSEGILDAAGRGNQ